jgi:hypothetical protein
VSPLAELGAAGTILDDLPEYEMAAPRRGHRPGSPLLKPKRKPGGVSMYVDAHSRRGLAPVCYCTSCVAGRPASRAFLEQERRTLKTRVPR